ncbi:cytochrome c class I [Stanieria cyanosphaera PCC 7437]|uniref:Cytochrome c class I n=1 Tax=Stanieria cyanosphaera (strain ATCC 29371 / PCC 7437) TaxID=111780 RepID=K9XUW5_STAC7|nr:c-type cytochrome [Stanieria cyanosphaera]AFZ35854.1 cytochrome c class I [Stanieria cyanosphaera PCC 7437]
MMKKIISIALILLLCSVLFFSNSVSASDLDTGAKIFEVNCAGCHIHGGNIVRRGKNLKQKTLQKNKLDSTEAIATLVTHGKNNMPAYQDRLELAEIEAVANYVLQQAQADWK